MIEYAFLIILVATILIGVVALAGQQVTITYNDIRTDIEVAVSGGSTGQQLASPHTCSDGSAAVFRHDKWRCSYE